MVKSKAEIMEQVRTIIGDNTSDEVLNLLSDLTDTIEDLEKKSTSDGEDWKKKYEDNDAQWRQKYKERFFQAVDEKQKEEDERIIGADDTPNEPELKTKFEELFNEKGE